MIFKNYYQILGVSPIASIQEIKSAYRKLSKKFHPDINAGDIFFEERFKEIQEAYENLADENRRRQFDLKYFPLKESNVNDSSQDEFLKKKDEPQKPKEDFGKWKKNTNYNEENLRTTRNLSQKNFFQKFFDKTRDKQREISYTILFLFLLTALYFTLKAYVEYNREKENKIALFKVRAAEVFKGKFSMDGKGSAFNNFECDFDKGKFSFSLLFSDCDREWALDDIKPNSIILKSFCYSRGHQYVEIWIKSDDVLQYKTRNPPIAEGSLKRIQVDLDKLWPTSNQFQKF
jgi:curved DNA-binding protein CbpA